MNSWNKASKDTGIHIELKGLNSDVIEPIKVFLRGCSILCKCGLKVAFHFELSPCLLSDDKALF